MDKWIIRFIDMATLISTWSKQPTTKVGCVITDNKNRVISIGYNGYPKGVVDDYDLSRDEKLRRTIHAEENAILFAKQSLEGAFVYITHPPCAKCSAHLIQVGIKKVMYLKPDNNFKVKWYDDIQSSQEMFKQSGVIFTEIEV